MEIWRWFCIDDAFDWWLGRSRGLSYFFDLKTGYRYQLDASLLRQLAVGIGYAPDAFLRADWPDEPERGAYSLPDGSFQFLCDFGERLRDLLPDAAVYRDDVLSLWCETRGKRRQAQ